MADGKWIEELHPEMSVRDAASSILGVRLGVFRHQFVEAATAIVPSVEHIHQLRVATRRAGTALRYMRPVLEKKPRRTAQELLREVRRTVGPARDWDVFLENVIEINQADETAVPLIEFLTSYSLGARSTVRTHLKTFFSDSGAKCDALCEYLPNHLAGEIQGTLSELVEEAMPRLLMDFTLAVESVPAQADALHATRILGKRLRYAIEIFACCYAPALQETVYPALVGIQELLGHYQDAVVALQHLESISIELNALRPTTATELKPSLKSTTSKFKKVLTGLKPHIRRGYKDWQKLMSNYPLADLVLTPSRLVEEPSTMA